MIFIDYPDVRDALAIVVCFGAASATSAKRATRKARRGVGSTRLMRLIRDGLFDVTTLRFVHRRRADPVAIDAAYRRQV